MDVVTQIVQVSPTPLRLIGASPTFKPFACLVATSQTVCLFNLRHGAGGLHLAITQSHSSVATSRASPTVCSA